MSGAFGIFSMREKLYLWLTNPESAERITELYRTLWLPVQTEYYTDGEKVEFWASEELPARPAGFQDAIVKQPMKFGYRDRN